MFKLRVCVKLVCEYLERKTSHRSILNAYYSKILNTKNTEKLHPCWQLQREVNKQFNKNQEYAVSWGILTPFLEHGWMLCNGTFQGRGRNQRWLQLRQDGNLCPVILPFSACCTSVVLQILDNVFVNIF